MTTIVRQTGFRQTVLAMAVLAAFAPAHAESESVAESTVSAGAALVTGDGADRSIFGQYNGLRWQDGYGLLDFDYYRRNDDTGTVTRFIGTNLGLQTRELSFLWKRQGDWRLTADYGSLVRYDPYTVNTGMVGAGSTTPQVVHLAGGPGTGGELNPGTKRESLGVAVSKWFGPAMQLDASIKTENKDGSRIFGRGMNCPSALAPGCGFTTGIATGWAALYLSEPIDSNHTQLEARLSYATGKLRLNGGYYGSFYNNQVGTLTPGVPGALNGPLGNLLPLSAGLQPLLSQAIALPPENEAHHFDFGGIYAFTPTTRANFKLAYTHASQRQDYAGSGLSGGPGGINNLSGEMDRVMALAGITSRPMKNLSLTANMRYEDTNDDTPLAAYNVVGAAPDTVYSYTNRNYGATRLRGKAQASYQFSSDYRGTLGVDYDSIDRTPFTRTSWVRGVSALRQQNEELSYRAELRRRMSENFSGTIAYVYSDRDGSNWLQPNAGPGVTEITDAAAFGPNAIFMPSLADRKREKIRLLANWEPMEGLALQFGIDNGKDTFKTPTDYGLRSSKMYLYTVDADYALTDSWNLNGFFSIGSQKLNQSRPEGYIMAFDNSNTSVGLGLTGKPMSALQVGARVSYFEDKNEYAQSLDANARANSVGLLNATGGLPDIVFRTTEFRLFGAYQLSKTSTIRVDAIYFRAKFNDWGYGYAGVPFAFGDNTTVSMEEDQSTTFIGARYIYRWQ